MPHDTDRTQLEYGGELSEYSEFSELASEQYEYPSELGNIMKSVFSEGLSGEAFEGGGYQEYQELPFPEMMEDELAAELLEVRSDQELDHFLGSLFSKVANTIGRAVKSPVGKALGGVLKRVAKQALPLIGKAVGSFFGGPVGGAIGGQVASTASSAFGLEYEGLSPEDRDFEVARRYVRFAGEAAKRATYGRPDAEPTGVAKAALIEAAKTHAPGSLAPPRPDAPAAPAYPSAHPSPPSGVPRPAPPTCHDCGGTSGTHSRTGKWVRRGRHIVLLGA